MLKYNTFSGLFLGLRGDNCMIARKWVISVKSKLIWYPENLTVDPVARSDHFDRSAIFQRNLKLQ